MLWMVFPWCVGYGVAASGAVPDTGTAVLLGMVIGMLCFALGVGVLAWGWESMQVVWKGLFICTAALLAVAWWQQHHPGDMALEVWADLPPRECEMQIEITKIHRLPRHPTHPLLDCDARFVAYRKGGTLEPPAFPRAFVCRLATSPHQETLREGAQVVARAVIYPPQDRYGTEFWYRNGDVLEVLETGEGSWLSAWRHEILERMIRALERDAPVGRGYAGYLQSMLTGDKRYLKFSQKQRIQSAGVMHFFAISGFHLSVIALICFSTLQLLRLPTRLSLAGMLAFCGFFVWLTGSPVSAQRAWIMLACYFVAQAVQRKPDALASTATAAWCVLLVDPPQLFTPGFQLSFVVVIGILTQSIPLYDWINGHRLLAVGDPFRIQTVLILRMRRVLQYFLGAFCVSWTAFWLSAPVVASTFGNVPFGSILVNTVLVPLFALILITGCLSAFAGVLGAFGVSGFLNHAAWVLLSAIDGVLQVSETLALTASIVVPGWMALATTVLMLSVGCFRNLFLAQNRAWLALPPAISLACLVLSMLLSLG